MLTTEWTAPQPAVTDLYKQVNTVTASLAMLNQIGGQVLALSDEYPDCEALSRLLATLRMERLGARARCRPPRLLSGTLGWANYRHRRPTLMPLAFGPGASSCK